MIAVIFKLLLALQRLYSFASLSFRRFLKKGNGKFFEE